MEHSRVAMKLTCPDCGGVLGPAEPGESSCTCFSSQTPSQPTVEESLSDTQPVETLTKVCFKCGTDVVGKKRYKDSRGYLCADCNRKEVEEEKAGTELCPNCGRRVKEAALTEFRGMKICKLCIAELKANDSKQIKVISGSQFDEQERKKLKILIIIGIVLLFFMILGLFKMRSG
jgi:DNA-directed RNA polymerase subunit RPC12/RpoP